MDVTNKRVFRILACCELMQLDHVYNVKTKHGLALRKVKGDRLRFLTLTVPEGNLPLREVASRFRKFSNTRWWRKLMRFHSYICVYEPHPSGHGWHIHILTNVFIPWREFDLMARSYLFGHTDIEAAQTSCAFYIAKYVTKAHILRKAQDSRNVRIVNVSRDLVPLYDVVCHAPSTDFIRENWDFLEGCKPMERLHFLYLYWVYTWSGYFLSYGTRHDVLFDKMKHKNWAVGGYSSC